MFQTNYSSDRKLAYLKIKFQEFETFLLTKKCSSKQKETKSH